MRCIDLTQTMTDGMPVFPGDPVPRLRPVADLAADGFSDHELRTGMHAGTHIDAPAHMLAGGAGIANMPVEVFFGRGRLIDARGQPIAGPELLAGVEIAPGDIALVLTGFSDRFGQPAYYRDYPEISEAFAEALIQRGVRLLGLDTPSPDRPPFRVHKLLLANSVLIIENLTNLAALLGAAHFDVAALPLKLDAGAAPARVMGIIRTQGEGHGADS